MGVSECVYVRERERGLLKCALNEIISKTMEYIGFYAHTTHTHTHTHARARDTHTSKHCPPAACLWPHTHNLQETINEAINIAPSILANQISNWILSVL